MHLGNPFQLSACKSFLRFRPFQLRLRGSQRCGGGLDASARLGVGTRIEKRRRARHYPRNRVTRLHLCAWLVVDAQQSPAYRGGDDVLVAHPRSTFVPHRHLHQAFCDFRDIHGNRLRPEGEKEQHQDEESSRYPEYRSKVEPHA